MNLTFSVATVLRNLDTKIAWTTKELQDVNAEKAKYLALHDFTEQEAYSICMNVDRGNTPSNRQLIVRELMPLFNKSGGLSQLLDELNVWRKYLRNTESKSIDLDIETFKLLMVE